MHYIFIWLISWCKVQACFINEYSSIYCWVHDCYTINNKKEHPQNLPFPFLISKIQKVIWGPNVVAQWLKLLPKMSPSHKSTALGLGYSISHPAPCWCTWKAAVHGSPPPTWKTSMEFQVLGEAWPRAGSCGHLENEPAVGKHCVFSSITLAFKWILKKKRK